MSWTAAHLAYAARSMGHEGLRGGSDAVRIRGRDNKAQEAQPAVLKRLSWPYVPFELQVIWAANRFSAFYAGPSNHCYIAI